MWILGSSFHRVKGFEGIFFFNLEGNLAFLYIKTHSYLWEFDLHHCLDFASCEISLPPPQPVTGYTWQLSEISFLHYLVL